MIKQVKDNSEIQLSGSIYGEKIAAAIRAYGLEYEFCRLFQSDSGGYILIFNSTLVADGEFDINELESFINIMSPISVEMPHDILLSLYGYKKYRRTLFKAVPGKNNIKSENIIRNSMFRQVFDILGPSFGITEFDMWYTDISHRIRHGVADLFIYENTTVTKQFDSGKYVFLSHIATAPEARGRGTAGNLLHYLCGELQNGDKTVCLFAKDERVTFYESLGFIPIYNDILYEK